jgi:hypothetical protein
MPKKRTKSSSLSKSNSLRKTTASAFRNDRKGFFFGDIPLVEFANDISKIGLTAETTKQVKLGVITGMCIALWLTQLRLNSNVRSPQEIEQFPSYKKIKRFGVISADSPVVYSAAIIATIRSKVYNECNNEEEILEYATELIESYTPNSKYYDTLIANNYLVWGNGFMSRTVGLFASCPATSLRAFNFPASCSNWTCQDVIKNSGPLGEGLEEAEVLINLHSTIFRDSGDFPLNELSFEERPLSS